MVLTALISGAAGNDIFVEIDPFEIGADPYVSGSPGHDKKRLNLTVLDTVTGRVERFGALTTVAGQPRSADTVVNYPTTGSRLVHLEVQGVGGNGPQATGTVHVITKPPNAGAFGKDVRVTVAIARRGTDGKVHAGSSVPAQEVTVFLSGSAQPTSPLELVTRLVVALNQALRSDPGPGTKLGDASIEGAVFEAGRLLRFRLSPPSEVPGTVVGGDVERERQLRQVRVGRPLEIWLAELAQALEHQLLRQHRVTFAHGQEQRLVLPRSPMSVAARSMPLRALGARLPPRRPAGPR